MLHLSAHAASLVALLILSFAPPAHAISNGQIDDFQDATLQGWGSGLANPNPPLVGPVCGPSGECGVGTDHYALVLGNGAVFGAGRGVVVANSDQWAGDYLAAGVNSIRMDVNNLGAVDLHLRLSIVSNDPNGGTFTLTESIDLAPHFTGPAGWTSILFDLDPANWTSTSGMATPPGMNIMTALSSVSMLRVHSSQGVTYTGDSIAGTLAMDNIMAVPEPGTFLLLACGLATLGHASRKR